MTSVMAQTICHDWELTMLACCEILAVQRHTAYEGIDRWMVQIVSTIPVPSDSHPTQDFVSSEI